MGFQPSCLPLLEVGRQLREGHGLRSVLGADISTKRPTGHGAYPVETFVQTISAGGASGLDVPGPLSEGVQAELVGDFRGVHGVGQICAQPSQEGSARRVRETDVALEC